jgi:hypothetical protein
LASPANIKHQHKPRRGLLIFAAYLLLSIILTLPLVLHLTTHLPFGGDAFQTVWDFWWLKKCLS